MVVGLVERSRCLCASLRWRWSLRASWMEACSQRAIVTSAMPSSSPSPSAPLTMRVRNTPTRFACSTCFTLKMEDLLPKDWGRITQTVQRQKWTETSAVPCVTCSSHPPLWPSPTIRAKPMPRESAWCWGSHPPYPRPWPALQTQIPLLPLRCLQTPLRAPLLLWPYPGPWQWWVETVGERPASIAACVEPGSTTPWWPSSTTKARNTAGTQPGHAFWSS